MTVDRAYSVLGLRPGASRIEVEQAYTASLRRLQLQMVPGMPLATRHQAQDQTLELTAAFEQVKNAATLHTQPTAASRPAFQPVFAVPRLVVIAGAVAVGIVTLLIVLFLAHSMAPETASEAAVHTVALEAPSGTARLRVLSVPWSYVEVDGTALGPSGQVDAFTIEPGECRLVLQQGDRVFPVTISVQEDCETIVQVQLEKGQIHVSHKKIRFVYN